ncbi:MAG: hypothetical protein WD184_04980 [Acidimicrobiia bacterium]
MKKLISLIALLAVVAVACGDDDAGESTTTTPTTTSPTTTPTTLPDGSVIAEFQTPDGETYRILLTGDAAVAARAAFASGTNPGIPNGKILAGDGGVNIGHEWHIVEVEFADFAIEVCDGTVSYIDDLGFDEYVNQHGDRYCPWSAELIGLIDG